PCGGEPRCLLSSPGLLALPPLPAEELRERVGAGKRALDRSSADGEHHPEEREQQADLAERDLSSERGRAEELRTDLQGVEDLGGDDDQGDREDAAERKPEERVHPVDLKIALALVPALL